MPGTSRNNGTPAIGEDNAANGPAPLPATCMRPEPFWWEVDRMDWWGDTWTKNRR